MEANAKKPKAKARPEPDTRQELGLKMPAASS